MASMGKRLRGGANTGEHEEEPAGIEGLFRLSQPRGFAGYHPCQSLPENVLNAAPPKRKRARLTEDESTEQAHDSSSVDRGYYDTLEGCGRSPPRSQYEMLRDGDFEHLDHTDEYFQRATQIFRSRTTTSNHNSVAESGIIEMIECNNFMCHKRLVVELGPLINFIVGENGSGKSAILTALTLCLGGKASLTNRGGTLKNFIKEGCDQAVLAVKIKNGGEGAFQPHTYGDSITIERHFSKSGTSAFKLKNAAGKIVSTKKSAVDDVSEWYSLQMDNPLNILSQDNARQFLNSSTPIQKYRFFMQGVQLEQLDNDYKMVMDLAQELEDKLGKVIQSVKDAGQALNVAQRLRETVSKNVEMREQARHCIHQLAWAKVSENEQLLATCEEEIRAMGGRIERAARAMADHMDEHEALEREMVQAQKALDEMQAAGKIFDTNVAEADNEYRQAKTDHQSLHAEHRRVRERWKCITDEVKTLEERIEEEGRRLDAKSGTARGIQNELALAQEAESTAACGREEARTRISALEAQRLEEKALLNDLSTGKLRQVCEEITRTHKHIGALKRDAIAPWAGFPRGMEQLVERINSDASFRNKPVGPLGAHIRLSKPQWTNLIESHLGQTLNAFIVTSLEDQRRLVALVAQMNMQCQIIIGNSCPIDLRGQLDPSIDTILRVCHFDNELVRNQLIVNNFIDRTLLTDNRGQAAKILRSNANLTSAITFKNDRQMEGIQLKKNASNGLSSSSPWGFSGIISRMKTDVQARVQAEQERASLLSRELHALEGEQERLQEALRRTESDIQASKNDEVSFGKQITEAQSRSISIQERLDDLQGVDGRLNALRELVEQRKATVIDEGNQYGLMDVHKSEVSKRVEQLKAKLTEAKMEKEEFDMKVQNSEVKIKQLEDARSIALAMEEGAAKERQSAMEAKVRCEEEREKRVEEARRLQVDARRCCPQHLHIGEHETIQSIERKYEALEAQLRQREKAQGATDEQINDRAERAKAVYDKQRHAESIMRRELAEIKLSLSQRLQKWRAFQCQITARTRVQFSYLLSERRYRGDIHFDHPARRLALVVEPDETQRRPGGRNTKTLSGGEKSFSSICMLLAVWEAMGSPIRCLDEFDVFMDNVNRIISTNMLIEAARQSVSRQFILITPNAIEGRAKLDKDVKIIRLTDPRQKTIPSMAG